MASYIPARIIASFSYFMVCLHDETCYSLVAFMLLDRPAANNETLTISNVRHIIDTGAYKCLASNHAAINQDISTVFVEEVDLPVDYFNAGLKQEDVYVIFNEEGCWLMDPDRCGLHFIEPTKIRQDVQHHFKQSFNNSKKYLGKFRQFSNLYSKIKNSQICSYKCSIKQSCSFLRSLSYRCSVGSSFSIDEYNCFKGKLC
ncbi:hypothetical protein HELRODRAFT_165969 [Helobdella robusta]|uniref:Ig-like domain-containing protein n=1 Tax=Helobdella robusta TaxID=6412 RepID=T1EXI6_HELRO|nr:hypothetical protein HELRODRAFT_165969 [Helobdella robusta]ESN90315.1 hypothetical protein HELRODRAFT_165969 [Helobdella robusta]